LVERKTTGKPLCVTRAAFSFAVANPPSRAGHIGRNAAHTSAKVQVAGEDENSPAADGSIKTARNDGEVAAGGGRR
jgi:hypothetical protein